MTLEAETASPDAGSNCGEGSDATTTRASEMSESSSRNGGQGRGQGGHTGRRGHQGRRRQGERFKLLSYTLLIRNFKVEVEGFGTVLCTTSEQREVKDQYKKFSQNLKQ